MQILALFSIDNNRFLIGSQPTLNDQRLGRGALNFGGKGTEKPPDGKGFSKFSDKKVIRWRKKVKTKSALSGSMCRSRQRQQAIPSRQT